MRPERRSSLFTLPDGYRDAGGTLHREGVLAAATVGDEIAALRDFRVYLRAGNFLEVMLARTRVRLGDLTRIDVGVVERLSALDRSYLQRIYEGLNGYEEATS